VEPGKMLPGLLHWKIGKSPVLEYRDQFRILMIQLFPEDGDALVPSEVLYYIDYKKWITDKIGVRQVSWWPGIQPGRNHPVCPLSWRINITKNH